MERAIKMDFKRDFVKILKGCLVALSVALVGILLFALFLRFFNVSDVVIKIVNQIIKFLSVFFGVFVCLKKDYSKKLLKGAIVGGLYTLTSYLVFSILVSTFSFGLSTLFDLLFATVSGMICAIILTVKR